MGKSIRLAFSGSGFLIAAAAKCDVWPTVTKYLALRESWYQSDVDRNPSQEVFLDGWTNRVDNLRDYLAGLA